MNAIRIVNYALACLLRSSSKNFKFVKFIYRTYLEWKFLVLSGICNFKAALLVITLLTFGGS